jgi:hypothetical protein
MSSGATHKKVIYLFGAGATHAVISAVAPDEGLTTNDIREKIRNKHSNSGLDKNVWNELMSDKTDIEHLISVLESQQNHSTAHLVRRYYRDALVALCKRFSKSPPTNLYVVLADLHKNVAAFDEELSCIITLNYEDILERSLKKHLGYDTDYVIQTKKEGESNDRIGVLKLHGSFNWINHRPVQTKVMTAVSDSKALWIPPGIDKKREDYPFNLLWGKATECLMDCDVVRVVGCSLSRNDWALIPVLYTAQRFNHMRSKVDVEVIDFVETGEQIQEAYAYLDVKKITDLEEIKSFYGDLFPTAPFDAIEKEIRGSMRNPFKIWLEAKIASLIRDGVNIDTPKRFLTDFYYKVN